MTFTLPAVPAWVDRAACTEDDAPLFYPEAGSGRSSATAVRAGAAKAICERCPVRLDCLTYGINDDWGIYGGLTAAERRTLREGAA